MICKMANNGNNEIPLVNTILMKDEKNYHAWQHRFGLNLTIFFHPRGALAVSHLTILLSYYIKPCKGNGQSKHILCTVAKWIWSTSF